jgi:hypothetical protein
MIIALRLFFSIVLVSMLWVTTWASMQCALWETPRAVATHPWFIATLFDTYWAFFTFYAWLAYKERTWAAKILWFIAIVLLGNIAMAVYMLIQLFRVKADAKIEDVLLRRA